MKATARNLTLLILMSITFIPNLQAQQQISGAIGVGSVRGDFFSDDFTIDGIGPHAQGSALWKTATSQFLYGGTVAFTYNQQERIFDLDTFSYAFGGSMAHIFVGASLKTYLASSVKIYNPYAGRLLPYVTLSAGVNMYSLSQTTDTMPTTGFTHQEGFFVGYGLESEFGLEYNITNELCVSLSAKGRTGFNDFWDGLKGSGVAPDFLVTAQLGVTYLLKPTQRF